MIKRIITNKGSKLLTAAALCAAILLAPAISDAYTCYPTEVIEYSNRVHIRCSYSSSISGDAIWYWAVSKDDMSQVHRFISMANTALVTGKSMYVLPSASNASGCITSNCRTPLAFGLQ